MRETPARMGLQILAGKQARALPAGKRPFAASTVLKSTVLQKKDNPAAGTVLQ
jgi:hypothetical protein